MYKSKEKEGNFVIYDPKAARIAMWTSQIKDLRMAGMQMKTRLK
jgi:hypothetical protein